MREDKVLWCQVAAVKQGKYPRNLTFLFLPSPNSRNASLLPAGMPGVSRISLWFMETSDSRAQLAFFCSIQILASPPTPQPGPVIPPLPQPRPQPLHCLHPILLLKPQPLISFLALLSYPIPSPKSLPPLTP